MNYPFVRAAGAALYIVGIVFVINTLTQLHIKELFIPMMMLGLLVLSALVMGFLFLSKPLSLYLDGEKGEAYIFFFKTVGFFAGFVVLFFCFILYQSITGNVIAPAQF